MLAGGYKYEKLKLTLGNRCLMRKRRKHGVAGDGEQLSSDLLLGDVLCG